MVERIAGKLADVVVSGDCLSGSGRGRIVMSRCSYVSRCARRGVDVESIVVVSVGIREERGELTT